ncbi:nitroreductase family protein [Alicyclobacillus vulcanalis]|uniref:Nitroreductase domain-containing protein n=1 Tax=Alicyclobacillus vulcanalis TaxID=252246 RepID=A0A1N7LMK4_9BACL|nr:nitroreductase family protein [Alicyclobacillus vulcanalis]SIS75068.1 hypothetical protein SAMN05421799_103260 [Alicyclobacillus vulcanalis]
MPVSTEKGLLTAIRERRSIHQVGKKSPLSDAELEQLLADIVKHMPSAYNSQSTRLVLLLGSAHEKLWSLVEDVMRAVAPPEQLDTIAARLAGFRSGYGTVLFFEDQDVIESFQKKFPANQDKFPVWAEHTNAMHQYAVWVALEAQGYGASLQHYNVAEDRIKAEWNLPETWRLIAQMPFGSPENAPREKQVQPVEARFKVFK